jgi:hypothetical protein
VMFGGCSTASEGSVTEYFCSRMAWMRATSDCWIVRYMLSDSPLWRGVLGLNQVY